MKILPEEKLLWAVLERGILDYIGQTNPTDAYAHHRWRANANGWVNARCFDEYSFAWICEALDLDPDTIRKRIHKLARQMLHFEPAAQGAVRKVLDDGEIFSSGIEKNPDRNITESVELERKRA